MEASIQAAGRTLVIAGLAVALQFGTPIAVAADDAVKAAGNHYKVEFENDQVRVLRVTYGPHEKAAMHTHPANVAIFLTDSQARFALPDGKAANANAKAGTVMWDPGSTHAPQNMGDKPMEVILVELKGKPAPKQ